MGPPPPSVVVGLLLIGLVALVIWAVSSNENASIRWKLRQTPVCEIASLIVGDEIRVTGRVVADRPLLAPLTGRESVYFEAVIEERRRKDTGHTWVTLVRLQDVCDFRVADATGEICVRTTGLRVELVAETRGHSGHFDDPTPGELAFLARYGISPTSDAGQLNRPLRYAETALKVGDSVTVLGRVTKAGDDSLVLEAIPGDALYACDDPSLVDGRLGAHAGG